MSELACPPAGFSSVTAVSFNADNTLFSVSTTTTFAVFSCEEPAVRLVALESSLGGMRIVAPIYRSPLLVLVSSGDTPGTSPRRLRLWNFLTKEVVRQSAFDSTVSACAVNKTHMVVGTEESILLFDLASFSQKHCVPISRGSRAVFALSTGPSDPVPLLAYSAPGGEGRQPAAGGDGTLLGEVAVLDCQQLRVVSRLRAHRSALSGLALSLSGALLATASVTGSLVRVFMVPEGTCLHELRHSLPGSLHVFSFLAASSGGGGGAGAADSVPGGAPSITALSFCPKSRYLLSASANAAGRRGGFLNVFRVHRADAAGAAAGAAATDGNASGDEDADYTKVEAEDAPSAPAPAESAPASATLAGSLQGWQRLLADSAATHLHRLRALSEEYVAAATSSRVNAKLTSGSAPALYVRLHCAQEGSAGLGAAAPGDQKAGSHHCSGPASRLASEEGSAQQQRNGLSAAPQSSGLANFHAMLSYAALDGGLALTVISAESCVLRRYALGFLDSAAAPVETVSLSDARAASTAVAAGAEAEQLAPGPGLPRTLGELLEDERPLLDL